LNSGRAVGCSYPLSHLTSPIYQILTTWGIASQGAVGKPFHLAG
jgi:hypothetical protein